METIIIALVSVLVLAALVAIPLAELVLARNFLATVCGEVAEPVTIKTDGSSTVFLMMELARLEEMQAHFQETYVSGDARIIPPLFAAPANSNSNSEAATG